MLDIKLIRENPDIIRESLRKRNDSTSVLDELISLDNQYRQILTHTEESRSKLKETSSLLGKIKEKPPALISEMRELGNRIQTQQSEVASLENKVRECLLQLPNIPQASVPEGKSDKDNIIVSQSGKVRQFDFKPLPHWDLGEALDIIDFQRGVKLSGTRFYLLKGLGARLERALIAFMLDLHVREHGYTEMYCPYMVKRECMVSSGNLPKFADNLYHDNEDDLWFIPTAEVPLTNLYRGEILDPGTLPLHYVAYTACFRREKMSAGKDTKGIKRGHQFDKVEMYKFVVPDTSNDELEKMLHDAADVCLKLGIPYRIIQICTGDLGFNSTKTYDIEMWSPGCEEWLEVSSCSNCSDFQARRADIRYRPEAGARPQFMHTLNGSGLALPRVLISILENYQQADGSIVVPEVLRPFMGVDIIKKQ